MGIFIVSHFNKIDQKAVFLHQKNVQLQININILLIIIVLIRISWIVLIGII